LALVGKGLASRQAATARQNRAALAGRGLWRASGLRRVYRRGMQFERVYSRAPWEDQVGYCRAIRAGNQIHVTGTAPVDDAGGVTAPGDPYAQAARCLELIEQALSGLGASRRDIVRTRMFVTDIERWNDYGRAHREFFGEHRPATTMVEVKRLIDPVMLIEIEADAVVA